MPNLFLNYDERFQRKVSNFPATLYRITDPTSKIYRLLYSLLEIGVGQTKGMQDVALLSQSSLANTGEKELDQYFQIFGIKRTPDFAKGVKDSTVNNSKFRLAISKFLQAINLGGTSEGLRLMAEASTGFKCHVVEPWRNPINAMGISRLKTNTDQPIGNEVIIYVYPNRPVTSDEANTIRVRLIENCKIIAPLHTSLTVVIQEVIDSLEFVPSYVTSESFSFIEEATEPELLSQEAEISFNDLVNHINTFEIDESFTMPLGNINFNVDESDTIFQIEEQETPLTSNFYMKIVGIEGEEIVKVKNRTFLTSPNIFSYEVERAQQQTTVKSFSQGDLILSNLVPLYSDSKKIEIFYESWQPIPLSDSPDNYPAGKFPNDARKYDSTGNYLFEWSSQGEFQLWFKNYINSLGGEVKNNQYRLLINENTSGDSVLNFNIINQIMGPSYQFVRPIPKPMD